MGTIETEREIDRDTEIQEIVVRLHSAHGLVVFINSNELLY